MSAPARQAPLIHVIQLVPPSRLCSDCWEATGISDRLSACSWSFDSASFGEILASPAEREGAGAAAVPWLPEALRTFWPFGRQRRHAQLLLSLGLLFSCFSRLRNRVRSCWVHHSFHLFRHLLVLHHRLLSEGIDVQTGSASLILGQRLAVQGTYHKGGRARR